MARDGKIFYKIAEKFKSSYPNIEIKYIYVSRKSLYLPGLDNITTESFQKMVLGDRLENVLDCFQMEDFSPNLTKYGDMRGRILIEALLNDTQFVEELKRRINTSKELLLKYLRQEGIDGKSAIVDLNGTRTCHKIISRIMNMNNNSLLYGYFFDLGDSRITGRDYNVMFVNSSFVFSRFSCNMIPVMMLEEYFSMADHPTTISYSEDSSGKIIPVFGKDTIDINMKARIFETNVMACQKYAEKYVLYIPAKAAKCMCYSSLAVLTEFINAPEYRYLKVFKGLTFSWTNILTCKILNDGSLLSLLWNRHRSLWFQGEFVYRCRFHRLATMILRVILFFRSYK